MLQCAAVCCSVLQCAAVCCELSRCGMLCILDCNTLQHGLQHTATCYASWPCYMARRMVLRCAAVCCTVFLHGMLSLQCIVVCCGVLRCVAVCYSVLQCVAVCCSVLRRFKIWHAIGVGHAIVLSLYNLSLDNFSLSITCLSTSCTCRRSRRLVRGVCE